MGLRNDLNGLLMVNLGGVTNYFIDGGRKRVVSAAAKTSLFSSNVRVYECAAVMDVDDGDILRGACFLGKTASDTTVYLFDVGHETSPAEMKRPISAQGFTRCGFTSDNMRIVSIDVFNRVVTGPTIDYGAA